MLVNSRVSKCSCLLPSHSAAKYILGPNPSSLSRPHPCLLPLPPFSRWRRGFQARPGTSPRRGRLSLASASAPPPSPSFPAVAARLPGEAGHGAPARPPLGAAATRRGGAPRGGGHSREHAPTADAGLASTPGSSRSLLPRSSGRGCEARALPGAAWWRGSPPAQVSSSSGDFGPDIHGSGAFALRFLDSESGCVQHGSPGEEGPRRGGLWCGGPGARGPWCGRGRPNNHPSRSAGDSVLNT